MRHLKLNKKSYQIHNFVQKHLNIVDVTMVISGASESAIIKFIAKWCTQRKKKLNWKCLIYHSTKSQRLTHTNFKYFQMVNTWTPGILFPKRKLKDIFNLITLKRYLNWSTCECWIFLGLTHFQKSVFWCLVVEILI